MNSVLSGKKVSIKYNDIIDCFEKTVEKYKTRPAFICKKEYTYKQVDAMSNKIANHLIDKGICEKDIVGISMDKDILFVATIIAVLKVKATCFIIDSTLPEKQLDFYFEKLNIKNIVTNGSFFKKTSKMETIIITNTKLSDYSDSYVHSYSHKDDVAFIFFTSGSTGNPKMVKITHGNILNDTSCETAEPKLNDSDIFLLTSPKASLRITGELFYPINAGATVVILSDDESKNRSTIIESIKKYNVTVMFAVPTMLKEMVNSSDICECSSLRMVQSLGEMLNNDLIDRFFKVSSATLYNVYGQTEIGMCTTHKINENASNLSICGVPVPNRKIYILDDEKQIVERGTEGEIYISGEYMNIVEEEKYDINIENEILVRTGDRGIINKDGLLIHCGRNDSVYKINGVRININDIETQINKFDAVKNTVVCVCKFESRQLIIAIIEKDKLCGEQIVSELKNHLLETLAPQMIPNRYIFIPQMPLLKSGKIDRERVKEYVNKEINNVKKKGNGILIEIVSKILNIDNREIDVTKTLFEIGLNSLQLIELQIELEEKIGKQIELEVLKNKTIERIL